MSISLQDLPLDCVKMDTANGVWLITVVNAMEAQNGQTLLLKLILAQSIDEEVHISRELSLMAPAAVILNTENHPQVVDRIRDWTEKTEGDGFLDLVRS